MARTVRSKGSPWTSTSARQNFFMSLEQSISQARLQNLGQKSHYSILLQVLSWVRSLTQHPDFSKAPKQVPRENCNNRVSMYSISCKPSSVSNKLETLGMRYAQFLCTQQPSGSFSGVGCSNKFIRAAPVYQNEGIQTSKDVSQLNYYVVFRLICFKRIK